MVLTIKPCKKGKVYKSLANIKFIAANCYKSYLGNRAIYIQCHCIHCI